MKIRIFMALLLAVSLAILSIGCAGSKAVNTTTTTSTTSIVTPIVGNKLFDLAPEFKLRDLDGNTVSLSDFRGSPVLINFWRIN